MRKFVILLLISVLFISCTHKETEIHETTAEVVSKTFIPATSSLEWKYGVWYNGKMCWHWQTVTKPAQYNVSLQFFPDDTCVIHGVNYRALYDTVEVGDVIPITYKKSIVTVKNTNEKRYSYAFINCPLVE